MYRRNSQFILYTITSVIESDRNECKELFYKFLEKYATTLQKMSEIDQEAFRSRLYEMARREIAPYGEEYYHR